MVSLSIISPECDNLTFECNFDADVLKAMLKDDTIPQDVRKMLKNINKHKKNHNTIMDTYTWTNDSKYGRMYCRSLQSISKEYRNGLLNNTCFELDMKNAHYTLLEQIGKKFKLPTEHIEYYNNNREECLKKLNEDRGKSKELYLMAEYGCAITELQDISNECKNILLRLKDEDGLKDLYKYAEKQFKKKDNKFKSLLHSFGAFALQTYENRCMLSVLDFIKQRNEDENDKIKVKIILHDGLIILINNAFTDELIREIENHVFDETTWKVKLDKKQCVSTYETPVKNYITIKDDEDVCNYLKKHYSNNIIHAEDDWYCRLLHTNWWSKGIKFIRAMIKNIDFRIAGDILDRPYSSTTSGMEKIIKYLELNCSLLFPIDKNFINDVNRKTEGLTFYQDKYYNWKTKTFHQIQSNNLPIIYIDRLAPDLNIITKKDIKDYTDKYLNMFDEKNRKIALRQLSRALAGHFRDKKWNCWIGYRNSGKGFNQEQVKYSFGEYCTTFNVPMLKTQHKGDASDMRWLLSKQMHLKRVGFSDETASIEGKILSMDGDTIKKIVSGGDAVEARGHHKDEVDVIVIASLFVSLNEMRPCEPADALQNCITIRMPYKFVDAEIVGDDICHKKKDETIKTQIKTERNRDIFTKIMFDAYGDVITEKDYTEEMIDERNEMTNGKLTEPPSIIKKMLVKDENEWLSTDELRMIFKPCKMSDTKLFQILKARGFIASKKSFGLGNNKKQVQGYKGYKLYIEPEPEYAEEKCKEENIIIPESEPEPEYERKRKEEERLIEDKRIKNQRKKEKEEMLFKEERKRIADLDKKYEENQRKIQRKKGIYWEKEKEIERDTGIKAIMV